MNPEIIHLEPYDTVHVVMDRMDQTRLERILLIFPTRRTPLNRRLDLKLLQRHAINTGKQMAVVGSKGKLVEYATDLGIPVFPSIRQAQSMEWKSQPRTAGTIQSPEGQKQKSLAWLQSQRVVPKPQVQISPALRYGIISLCALAVLSLFVFLLPSAEVILTPATQLQELHMTVTANPTLSSYTLTGDLPAKRVTVVVEGREEMDSSGNFMLPLKAASGEVTFTNLSDQEISIPSGTVVRNTSETPQRFSTQASTNLPAEAGAATTVQVQALNPGSSGNLPADSINIVDGDLKLFVTVTNQEATEGGSEQESLAPSDYDYEILSNKLRASLWQSAINEVKSEQAANDLVIESSPLSFKILDEQFDPPEPQPAATLSLQMRIEYNLLVVSGEEMQNMISRNLDATLPQGFAVVHSSLVVLPETEPEINENGSTTWTVYAQRQIVADYDIHQLRSIIAGKTRSTAAAQLQELLDLAAPPQIKFSPSWWPVLPWLPIRISIEYGVE